MRPLLRVVASLLSHPGMASAVGAIMVVYALLYLWLTGDIMGGGQGGWLALFPAWERVWETRGPFQFEPVGLFFLGKLVWTFSPINTLLALIVGLLVGLNLVAGWRLWRAPRACGLGGSGTGLLAAIPALLAGGACCAPLVLIWLGLPIAGAVASLAPVLIPLAVVLLLAGLWGMASRLDVARGGQLDDAEHSR
ncbi:hypothetical protein HOP52_10205 [Halomonas campisalis]|uniref:Uncharacterized protein n=1 Tax=Billgrantia campisalis TaxID=74661 RepID=A0ABS9P8M6_9GAMM|nr:hypothetical protein [Halomonas campisalis]MCG6658127.1 hypothetical protein [Halomonas campisalis]MDR5862794.1 hypothetical protein [Halomonas campisalis]